MFGNLNGQMVSIIKYSNIGENNTLKVLFKVADTSKRKVGKEYVSDFFLCEAYGGNAEFIRKHFDLKDKNGKFVSRKISMWGSVRTYKSETTRPVTMNLRVSQFINTLNEQANAGLNIPADEIMELEVPLNTKTTFETDSFIFHAEKIDFADYVKVDERGVASKGDDNTPEIVINLNASTETYTEKGGKVDNAPPINDSPLTSDTQSAPPVWDGANSCA